MSSENDIGKTLLHDVFISIGSNVDPERHLPQAVERLRVVGKIVGVSTVYQNPAIDEPDQPDYLNAAVHLRTSVPPDGVRNQLKNIERALGRIRSGERNAERTMDLDLCLYGDLVLSDDGQRIPHPQIEQRACVATPLAELAPGFIHPVLRETLQTIADRLPRPERFIARRQVAVEIHPARSL